MDQKITKLIIPLILSVIVPGAGQIKMRRFFKGIVLIISFTFGIIIVWLSTSDFGFKLFSFKGREVYFNPSVKYLDVGVKQFKTTDLMKITGVLQLIVTWIYGVLDVFKEKGNVNGHCRDATN